MTSVLHEGPSMIASSSDCVMTPASNSNVQLLAVLADFDDVDLSEYRFLVDGKDVKYVTVDPGILPSDDRTFAPVLIPTLPTSPLSDWNRGHVSKDPQSGQLVFSCVARNVLEGISNTWHDIQFDHLEFLKGDRIRQNIHVVTHPLFDRLVLVKFAEFPRQNLYFEAETKAYERIAGKEVGPKFLGHLTEAVRIFGFVMEYLDGARSTDTGDLAACQDALAKLHSLGIKYGDINKYNFLVREGKVVLVDFGTAEPCLDKKELEAE